MSEIDDLREKMKKEWEEKWTESHAAEMECVMATWSDDERKRYEELKVEFGVYTAFKSMTLPELKDTKPLTPVEIRKTEQDVIEIWKKQHYPSGPFVLVDPLNPNKVYKSIGMQIWEDQIEELKKEKPNLITVLSMPPQGELKAIMSRLTTPLP